MTTSVRSLALLALSWGAAPRAPQAGALEIGDPYFPGLGNGGYDVEHYALELELDMHSNEVAATARIRARALDALTSFSFDLYGLELAGVRVDGQDARFERTPPAPLPDGASGKKTSSPTSWRRPWSTKGPRW